MFRNAVVNPPVLVALIVNIVRESSSVGVPVITPVEVSNARPAGRLGVIVHDKISPWPFKVGVSGRSLETVLLIMLKSSGVYEIKGIWSTTVMLRYVVEVPPVLVALIVNIVRVTNSVGVPLRTPVEVSNARPAGRLGVIVHEIISPCPVKVGDSGTSLEAVLLVILKSSGVYVILGSSSIIVMLTYDVEVPPVFDALIVNIVRASNSVGVPLITPVEVSIARPLGKLGVMVQETISPEPVKDGESGRSLDTVLLVILKSLAE